MSQDRILSLVGLAERAGAVKSGAFMTETAVKNGSAHLVILGTDASANTKKEFRDMCAYYGVPAACYATKEELGHALGKELRSVLAVTDAGFADSLLLKLKEARAM